MGDVKASAELQEAIKSVDHTNLKEVTSVEKPTAKHDRTMYDVEKFEKGKLNQSTSIENHMEDLEVEWLRTQSMP